MTTWEYLTTPLIVHNIGDGTQEVLVAGHSPPTDARAPALATALPWAHQCTSRPSGIPRLTTTTNIRCAGRCGIRSQRLAGFGWPQRRDR